MPLALVLAGQLAAALEHGYGLVYEPPMRPAGRVDGIEVSLQGIAGQ
ncbi:hypothetical protein [Xanthomonas prunicola]|nr:hypothetical protein [Xanthomonas prunicola]